MTDVEVAKKKKQWIKKRTYAKMTRSWMNTSIADRLENN
jgi:hypothetical protein